MTKVQPTTNSTLPHQRVAVSAVPNVQHGDARALSMKLLAESVDVTITSPPYYDLKDYGVKNQIGFGQGYEDYLNDLKNVFSEILRATKKTGSLWIVIDTFRKGQEVLPLPFDLTAKLKEIGWSLRDVIIWKKERTLPWAHKGATRKIFEYILVFSKPAQEFRYYPDRHREFSDLKRWWVRYPERYNPKGKALEEIWSYDIPTQGSWGKSYIRHFCPLPSDLVKRIIELTTDEGDVVLDPFSGTGTVPAEAFRLNRNHIGFELNAEYIAMFKKYLKSVKGMGSGERNVAKLSKQKSFEQTVVALRILKYARLLYKAVLKIDKDHKCRIFVERMNTAPSESHQICTAEYLIVGAEEEHRGILLKEFELLTKQPPLSKFGVDAYIKFPKTWAPLKAKFEGKKLYCYSKNNTHHYAKCLAFAEVRSTKFPILSTLQVSVEEPHD